MSFLVFFCFINNFRSSIHDCFLISAKEVQQLSVYEINERDRGSPAYLRLSQKSVNSLGDLVPFSNKVSNFNPFKFFTLMSRKCDKLMLTYVFV